MVGPVSEYEFEPIRGLPEELPAGEQILWQGAPDGWTLARRAFHVLKIAAYFALLGAWRIASRLAEGAEFVELARSLVLPAALGGAAVALFTAIAWLIARTTVYTITSHRVVMRFGVALPITLNLPFRGIRAVHHRPYADGTGDIPLEVENTAQLGYAVLWPHARPWRIGRPEPMLRAVRGSTAAAERLAAALAASTGAEHATVRGTATDASDYGGLAASGR